MSNKQNLKNSFDVFIFDIDNVIVDTRFSYTDCIRETVQTYFERHLQFKSSHISLLSKNDVEQFKLLGGFNDDWDTCYGLILYLLSLKPKVKTTAVLRQSADLKNFSRKVKKPLFVKGVERVCGRNVQVKIRAIAQIFQRLYWSKYIRRESLIIPKTVFKKIAESGGKIGIATGRSRREANYVFKRFGISKWIRKMVAVDDLPGKNLKKPNPYSLLKIGETFGRKLRYLYVGDLPDDMQTAKAASRKMNVTPWGFSHSSLPRKEIEEALKKAGAKKVVRTASELNRLLVK